MLRLKGVPDGVEATFVLAQRDAEMITTLDQHQFLRNLIVAIKPHYIDLEHLRRSNSQIK